MVLREIKLGTTSTIRPIMYSVHLRNGRSKKHKLVERTPSGRIIG